MAYFELTPEHLDRGHLSDSDYSGYTGFAAKIRKFSDYPHWDILQRGDRLSIAQHSDRANAILVDLSPCVGGGPVDSSRSDSTDASYRTSPLVYVAKYEIMAPDNITSHFQKILEHGVDVVVNNPASTNRAVIPGVATETNVQPEEASRLRGAFMLVHGADIDPKEYWAKWLGISPDKVSNYPKDGLHNLADELHEMRHLVQTILDDAKNKLVLLFYAEADADLFAFSVLRQASKSGNTLETKTAWMHGRYAGYLLAGEPDHWIAPVIDALEAGRKPPDFYETFRATMEVRLRLMMEANGDPRSRAIDSATLQKDIAACFDHPGNTGSEKLKPYEIKALQQQYNEWVKPYEQGCMPEEIYPMLKNLVDSGVFQEKLSSQISHKIIDGVNYFAPAMLREPVSRPEFFPLPVPLAARAAAAL